MALLSPTLVSAMMTACIAGAGLVIAFYALIARMFEDIFSYRFELLEEKTQEVERIRSNPASFKEDNLESTSSRLRKLSKEIDSIKTFPRYLTFGVGISFALFLTVSTYCVGWLYYYSQPNNPTRNDWILVILFLCAIGLFGSVGGRGLADVRETLKIQFKDLAIKKTEIKEDIKYAPKEAEVMYYIQSHLTALKVKFESNVTIKVDGKLQRPDIIIPSVRKPKYLIEVLARPKTELLYRLSTNYEHFKVDTGAKTIIIADFRDSKPLMDVAKAYWDFIIDSQDRDVMIDRLREIIANEPNQG